MKIKFVMNDESVNSYGFKVRTDGIDIERFLKNPVALYMHARSGYNRDLLPIGKWVNVEKVNGKLVGELEFDEDDEFAVKLYNKCEKGILNGTSMGIAETKVIETDDEIIVDECELRECSIVDIPSNANAVRLYDKNECVELSLELCNQLKESDMPTETTDKAKLQELQTEVIETAFATALANGNVTESQKEFYLNASKTDFDGTHKHLKELAKPSENNVDQGDQSSEIDLNSLLGDDESNGGSKDERADWSYLTWYKNDLDGLLSMKKEDPKRFEKLLKDQQESVKSDKNLMLD